MNFPPLEKFPHALVITGNRQVNLDLLKKYLAGQDVIIFDQESLKIDALRNEIITLLTTQKVSDRRFVVISMDHFGFEAQNAFLKSLEEPQVGTYIIILISDENKLLPTVLSRAQLIQGEYSAGESRLEVKAFLGKSLADKFAYVESWTKAKKDEDNVSKSEVIHFTEQLEKYLWEKGERNEQLFRDIRQMREYATIRGASHRVILDYLAIMLS